MTESHGVQFDVEFPEILGVRQLQASDCSTPGCTDYHPVVWLHARCHPRANLMVGFNRTIGTLDVLCPVCRSIVSRVQVAPEPGPGVLPRT